MVDLVRIDAVPLSSQNFTPEFERWLANLVDSINETIQVIEDSLNLLNASSYTDTEIATLESDGQLTNGIVLYDTTNNVYVGRESGVLVKFTTGVYP